MFTSGSKLLFGMGALAAVAAIVYAATSGDFNGTIVWAVFATAAVFLGASLIAVRDADVAIPAVDPADPGAAAGDGAVAVAVATVPPLSASLWPLAGALSAAIVVLGLVTDSRVFLLGAILGLATVIEWMVQAWSDRASADPAFNDEVRGQTLQPIEFPVLGAAALAVVILGFSRVMLALSSVGSLVVFVGIAVLILAVAAVLAVRPSFSQNVVAALLALGGLGIVAGGVAGAASGSREFEAETAIEAEPEDSVREVSAKAANLGTITALEDRVTISLTGGREVDVLRIPKSLDVNVLFVNGANEPLRLVIEGGEIETTEEDAEGNAVVEPLEFETGLVRSGNTNFLTFSIPVAGEYEFFVRDEAGADVVTGTIVTS